MEARPTELMPSPPRPAAEFDRETATGLDVFAMRDPGSDTLAGGQQSLITQMSDSMAHGLPTDLQRR
jgi:hypothetical protein